MVERVLAKRVPIPVPVSVEHLGRVAQWFASGAVTGACAARSWGRCSFRGVCCRCGLLLEFVVVVGDALGDEFGEVETFKPDEVVKVGDEVGDDFTYAALALFALGSVEVSNLAG